MKVYRMAAALLALAVLFVATPASAGKWTQELPGKFFRQQLAYSPVLQPDGSTYLRVRSLDKLNLTATNQCTTMVFSMPGLAAPAVSGGVTGADSVLLGRFILQRDSTATGTTDFTVGQALIYVGGSAPQTWVLADTVYLGTDLTSGGGTATFPFYWRGKGDKVIGWPASSAIRVVFRSQAGALPAARFKYQYVTD